MIVQKQNIKAYHCGVEDLCWVIKVLKTWRFIHINVVDWKQFVNIFDRLSTSLRRSCSASFIHALDFKLQMLVFFSGSSCSSHLSSVHIEGDSYSINHGCKKI